MQTETESLRLFVAIRVPDSIKAKLRDVQTELEAVLPKRSAAWTKPEAMHLTMRFLGQVRARDVSDLGKQLREGLSGFGRLDLLCERLGCFPDLRFPRVIWAWVHDANGRLAALHRLVNEASKSFAEKPAEKRFEGHITLARPKGIKRPDADQLSRFVEQAVSRQFGVWCCDEVELIRSELSADGSRYTTLATVNLNA